VSLHRISHIAAMVRMLETILEVGHMDDAIAYDKGKDLWTPKCESIDSGSEPEQELDPLCADAPSCEMRAETRKDISCPSSTASLLEIIRAGRPNAILIGTTLKAQHKSQPRDMQSDKQHQIGPIYILYSDLVADWSRYIPKPDTRLVPATKLVHAHEVVNVLEFAESQEAGDADEVACKKSRRRRKKSLIDKAARSQHNQELSPLCEQLEMQRFSATPSQIQRMIALNGASLHA